MFTVTRRALGVCVLAMATVLALPSPAQAAPADLPVAPALPFPVPPSPPEFDPAFYAPPTAAFTAKKPGEIIAARRVNVANFGVIPLNVDAWQLSFRSTNTRGEPIPAVTTVLKPRGQVKPGARKLVSFQMAEDALAQYCAPSYAMQLASLPTFWTGSQIVALEFLEVQAALVQGWAVAVPDYQGMHSAYAAGPLGGRIVLDGVRAAENFAPMELSGAATRTALWGYSGGAIATGHAAELHKSYAPELNIVAVAEGGMPADLGVVLNNANNTLPSGLVMGAILGLAREYPDFEQFLRQHLNPLGQALWALKNPLCVSYQAATLPFLNLKGLLNVAGDPLEHPVVKSVLDRTRMGKAVPAAPMFIYQSKLDWIIPVGQVDTLVSTYCKNPRATIAYTRDGASEHLSLGGLGAPSALLWLRDRLDGVPAQPGCSTRDVASMALDPGAWQAFTAFAGELLAGLFGKAIGR